jgi:hybrid cluster-associated redox disulfide protein
MKNSTISSEITVKEIFDRYPQLVQTFMELRLLCVGCPAEAFHTLNDVAREYLFDLNQLRQRLDADIVNEASSQEMSITENNG